MKAANIITILGVGLFLGCAALGAFAWFFASKYWVPISAAIPILTAVLPSVDFFTAYRSIVCLSTTSKKRNGHPLSVPYLFLNLLFLLLPAIMLAYSSTYLGKQKCNLMEQWKAWFSAHDMTAIKDIQERLQCCGFGTVLEMPFPPPTHKGNGHPEVPANACKIRLGADAKPCYPLWEQQLGLVSGLLVAANAVMIVMKFVFLLLTLGKPELVANIFNNRRYNGYTQTRAVEEIEEDGNGQDHIGQGRPRGRVTNGVEEEGEVEEANSETRMLLPHHQGDIQTDPIANAANPWTSYRTSHTG